MTDEQVKTYDPVKAGRPSNLVEFANKTKVTPNQAVVKVQAELYHRGEAKDNLTTKTFKKFVEKKMGRPVGETSARNFRKLVAPITVSQGYNQNHKRHEGLIDIYNPISHIVAIRTALGYITSTSKKGYEEGDFSDYNPRKLFNIDASSHYLGSNLETAQSIILPEGLEDELKRKSIGVGVTTDEDFPTTQRRSIKYLFLINTEVCYASITILKDSCFDSNLIQLCFLDGKEDEMENMYFLERYKMLLIYLGSILFLVRM